ncbi:MAG: flippase-like domain-containing protein [Bacteroidaceae bacterium]|nr:flippase-like domain-containing protein [Bacteroidaceae bacterium]
MKKVVGEIVKIGLPFLLAGAILWWMYRGFDWNVVKGALSSEMSWTWMLLSMPFGILAQVFRGLRWRQVLEPMGEKPRVHTCINAIFLSYASSLVVPRVGEILRCGVLKRYEGTNFSQSIGTVVTERVVDVMLILIITLFTILLQIPVFAKFMMSTGLSFEVLFSRFTATGYLVTFVCLLVLVLGMWLLFRRFRLFSKTRDVVSDVTAGILSVRHLRNPLLFLFYSLAIWICYYLHFYLTFFCFDFTENLGAIASLVAFVVGTFAVLVPTPNGAGPWHFAVKTILVLYGVGQTDAAIFVLLVHTLQTFLVALLGIYALVALFLTKPRKA